MRSLVLISAVLAASAVTAGAAPAATSTPSTWATQANAVCVVWLAKANKEFGHPVTPAQLFTFANKANTLETQEFGVLSKIPNRTTAGTAALNAVVTDINEVRSAINAYAKGKPAQFVTILKKYLNDGRAKKAFAAAGATKCG
jgi:hypothetical protein